MNTVSHPYVDKVTSVTRDGVVTKFHYNARGMFATSRPSGTSAANPPDLARIPSDFCQIALLCFANPTKSWLKRIEFSLRSPKADWLLVAKERDGKIIETLGWDGIRLRLEDIKSYGELSELGTQLRRVKSSRATAGQVGLVARDDTVFANEAHISGGVPLVAATSDGSDASYFDSDYLGTTTASYTADGEVNAYEHGSFGQGTELADASFTGKHYDADLGAHVFPFRNYRSDAGRWTSADPAGFPDGPNQHFYAPVPNVGLDPLGLWRSGIPYGSLIPYHTDITDRLAAAGAPTVFGGFGFDLSKRAVEHLIAGTTATIPDIVLNAAEQAAFIADTAFQDVRDFVQSYVELQGGNHTSFGPPLAGVGIRFGGWTDLALAIQNVTVHLAGSITPVLRAGTVDIYDYSGDLTVSFIDPYDFRIGSNPLVNVFARLETHLWSSAFNITGNWSVNFSGEF